MPKGFKLTSEQPKYNGKQEPAGWLEDYKMAVNCQRGTSTTAMQYIQLMLEGTARDWLKALPPSSYDSWEEFSRDFIKNFEPLAVRPKTFEELRSCVQKPDETLRAYIRRWTEIRNSVKTTSEDMVIDAFCTGSFSTRFPGISWSREAKNCSLPTQNRHRVGGRRISSETQG